MSCPSFTLILRPTGELAKPASPTAPAGAQSPASACGASSAALASAGVAVTAANESSYGPRLVGEYSH